jgi:hypothetical protein
MHVTNSGFFENLASGESGHGGVAGGLGAGGAVAWQTGNSDTMSTGVTIVMTDDNFVYNHAFGGNSVEATGGSALGGAVCVDASMTDGMSVTVSNNWFNNSTAAGGDGYYGGRSSTTAPSNNPRAWRATWAHNRFISKRAWIVSIVMSISRANTPSDSSTKPGITAQRLLHRRRSAPRYRSHELGVRGTE